MQSCKEETFIPALRVEAKCTLEFLCKDSSQESQTFCLGGFQIPDLQWAWNEGNSVLLGVPTFHCHASSSTPLCSPNADTNL